MAITPKEAERALRRARLGDGDALATLWRVYHPKLLRYVRGRGLDDPEGVTSQVWIDVARHLGDFDGDVDDFRRWLFTIARRRVIDEIRLWSRRVQTSPIDKYETAPTSSPGADAVADERAALARALALVGRLPEEMRDAVLLRVVADLSVNDTARVMGRSAGNVRVLVHRGLRRLEQLVAADREVVTPLAPPAIKGMS